MSQRFGANAGFFYEGPEKKEEEKIPVVQEVPMEEPVIEEPIKVETSEEIEADVVDIFGEVSEEASEEDEETSNTEEQQSEVKKPRIKPNWKKRRS